MPNIYVEVVPKSSERGELAAAPGRREEFKSRAIELADSLTEVASLFRSRLDQNLGGDKGGGPWSLDEVELAFSLDLETEAGVIITVSAKAGFEAKLTWKRT